jgi:hypothetical protein
MMKTTALSLILGTMFFLGAAQAQPAKLTTSQMDQVTAGDIYQTNDNYTEQYARARANSCGQAGSGCSTYDNVGGGDIYSRAKAEAYNLNENTQANLISFGD